MRVDRRTFITSSAATGLALGASGSLQAQEPGLSVRIDLREPGGALPHIWEQCAGSDRAAITLREDWRKDLGLWKRDAGLKRVRFHGIFADELGVDAPSILSGAADAPPNWQNVDRVYDGLIEQGVTPFVELDFMPKRLASGARTFGFYGGNVTPPTSMDAWSGFIRNFATHLIDRYGAAQVAAWPFEVWNEPNLPFFWSGTQQQYFDLYKATAVTIKSINPQIQVGGPATASSGWISEFLSYCDANNAPVDFVSSHAYPGDNQAQVFGQNLGLSQNEVIPESVRRIRAKIDATRFKGMPFWLSEWSSDSPAMIAHVLKECLPHAQGMSHWTLSNVYEELGVANYVLKEGSMGWGALVLGIALPAFNTYRLLHRLGAERLTSDGPALASRRPDGSVAALVWNLARVKQPAGIPGASAAREVTGAPKRLEIEFAGARPGQPAHVSYVDWNRGCPLPAWRAMGSPQYPRPDQLKQLRRASEISTPQLLRLDAARKLTLDLPPEGIALIELAR